MIISQTIWWMYWTIVHVMPSCSGIFIVQVNHFPDHLQMPWTNVHIMPSCSGIFMVPANNFPDHPVNAPDYFYIITVLLWDIYDHFPDHLANVLDYYSCNAIMPWDIYCLSEQFPKPSLNVLDYFSCNAIMLQDICGFCKQFPRPSCEYPGLFLYNYHLAPGYLWCRSFPRPSAQCPGLLFTYMPSCPGIFIIPVKDFPDHPSMSWTILDYSCIISILLQDMYDSCDQFPRPHCECPGLLLIRGQNNVHPLSALFDKVQRSPVRSASSNHRLFK